MESKTLYSKEHEWIRIEGSTAIIGITEYAQNAVGDIVFVELPDPGDEFTRGDEVGVIESVKAASEIYAPVSCVITEVNQALQDTPGMVNESAEGSGWLIKIQMTNPPECEDLMTADAYRAHTETEDQ